MGIGFIQLITVGNEFNIFNKEPNITFFKIYYRRHTNFFINNYEINGNNLINNNLLKYKIPKNGDLLSTTYLKVIFEEHYVELFQQYDNLYSTLNTDILSFYDSYSVRTDLYNIDEITNINIIKLKLYDGEFNYFNILCTNIKNEYNLVTILKSKKNIYLEIDYQKIFYNINMFYLFYGFILNISPDNFFNDNLIIYILNEINYELVDYLIIDITNLNLSYKIKFVYDELNKYIFLFNTILKNNIIDKNILNVRIDKYALYISITYTNKTNNLYIINLLFNYIFSNIKTVTVEIINNKIKPKYLYIDNNVNEKLKNLFFNINSNYYTYYDFIVDNDSINLKIYSLKDSTFFGNYTPLYFNDSIIYNETSLISTLNLYAYKLPINFYIKLILTLICNNDISIQEYLKLINGINYQYTNYLNKYTHDAISFNNKILNLIIDPKVLILSKNTFRKILYQNNIKNNYSLTNQITPFTNRIISQFQNVVLDYYTYYDIIFKFSNRYNQTFNLNNELLLQTILLTKLDYSNVNNSNLLKTYLRNYIYNNNLFNFVLTEQESSNIDSIIFNKFTNDYSNYNSVIVDNLIFNYLTSSISSSINIILNIFNQKSSNIYSKNGKLTNIFYDSALDTIIFPFSSGIYIKTNSIIDKCPTKQQLNLVIASFTTIFNISEEQYYNNIFVNIQKKLLFDFNFYNTNYNNTINFGLNNLLNNTIIGTKFYNIVNKYYEATTNNQNLYDIDYIQNFMNSLIEINFISIYSNNLTYNINDFVLYNLFIYCDNELYNGAFSNYIFYLKNCNADPIKTNFITQTNYLKFTFLVNSPIYRIYYLFTYLGYLTIDPQLENTLPSDLANLRDITLLFILIFIKFFNNINPDIIQFFEQKLNYINVNNIQNINYRLNNNFLCFDSLDLFNDTYFQYLLSLNNENIYIYLFISFFFKKDVGNLNIFNLFSSNNQSINVDNINNFINKYKYNYDDSIIIVFLATLEINKNLFVYYDDIYQLVNLFFDKSGFYYNDIVAIITKIFNQSNLVNIYNKNTVIPVDYVNLLNYSFYYNCYYTINTLGIIFDNTTENNMNTINGTYNLILEYNSNSINTNFYNKKSIDVKQYINFLNNDNIITSFKFIESLFNDILLSYNTVIVEYYDNLITSIIKYIKQNIIYFMNYNIDEIIFKQCYNKLLVYLYNFNQSNNSNITLLINYPFTKNNFITYNIITIDLLYLSFIEQCLNIDIQNYLQNSSVYNNFNNYIVTKYSYNIYIQCLEDFIIFTNNSGTLITLNYSSLILDNLINFSYNEKSYNYLNKLDKYLFFVY